MKTVADVFVDRLNRLMDEKGLNQYKLAELSGVPYPTIKSMFQRRTHSVDLTTIVKLAYGLGVSASELIDDENLDAEKLNLV